MDFHTCPNCHQPLQIRSLERIEGHATINMVPTPSGETAAWEGSTEMDWDSSRTHFYFCDECGEELPEAYQEELDRMLGNRRDT